MKHLLSTIAIVLFSFCTYAQTTSAVKADKSKDGFWHHSGEIAITPSADYYIFKQGNRYKVDEPYEFRLPFIGFNISGQYLYRPVKVFAVSTGLAYRMQGNFYRETDYSAGKKYVNIRGYGHLGYLSLPIEFHLFKKMPGCTFEFATGPQFNFPVNGYFRTMYYNPAGEKIDSEKGWFKYPSEQIRQFSTLGWNVVLGGEIHLATHADLFIGPQINFVNIALFDKFGRQLRNSTGGRFDCSLGLKLGFRIHCEE